MDQTRSQEREGVGDEVKEGKRCMLCVRMGLVRVRGEGVRAVKRRGRGRQYK